MHLCSCPGHTLGSTHQVQKSKSLHCTPRSASTSTTLAQLSPPSSQPLAVLPPASGPQHLPFSQIQNSLLQMLQASAHFNKEAFSQSPLNGNPMHISGLYTPLIPLPNLVPWHLLPTDNVYICYLCPRPQPAFKLLDVTPSPSTVQSRQQTNFFCKE